ncbi:hypothetical protein E2C01_077194 [Portunus trituberculatus]|uniref:Uncharacterized protein n=1 Tax=Portunus trituberculatus TaxID=210409 RepID=A0A5B7IF73_PORTR|nr:hypothetical protein [Portunus trituberculatus]
MSEAEDPPKRSCEREATATIISSRLAPSRAACVPAALPRSRLTPASKSLTLPYSSHFLHHFRNSKHNHRTTRKAHSS